MRKYMRWSAVLVVLMLVLAACQSDGGSDASDEPTESAATGGESTAPEASEDGGGTGSSADCDADEFGCIEIAEGDPLVIGTALVISGANETLGTDSQIGAEVARELRPEIAGHEVEFNHQDEECGPEGGTELPNGSWRYPAGTHVTGLPGFAGSTLPVGAPTGVPPR